MLPWLERYWDKAQHAAAFLILTLAALWVLGYPALSSKKCAVKGLWASAYAFVVGGSIEYLQLGIPGRNAESADLVADMVGAAAAVLFALTILRRRERLKRA